MHGEKEGRGVASGKTGKQGRRCSPLATLRSMAGLAWISRCSSPRRGASPVREEWWRWAKPVSAARVSLGALPGPPPGGRHCRPPTITAGAAPLAGSAPTRTSRDGRLHKGAVDGLELFGRGHRQLGAVLGLNGGHLNGSWGGRRGGELEACRRGQVAGTGRGEQSGEQSGETNGVGSCPAPSLPPPLNKRSCHRTCSRISEEGSCSDTSRFASSTMAAEERTCMAGKWRCQVGWQLLRWQPGQQKAQGGTTGGTSGWQLLGCAGGMRGFPLPRGGIRCCVPPHERSSPDWLATHTSVRRGQGSACAIPTQHTRTQHYSRSPPRASWPGGRRRRLPAPLLHTCPRP